VRAERLILDRPTSAQGEAFLARLARLLDEVEGLNRQLERIEAEMEKAFRWTALHNLEEHR